MNHPTPRPPSRGRLALAIGAISGLLLLALATAGCAGHAGTIPTGAGHDPATDTINQLGSVPIPPAPGPPTPVPVAAGHPALLPIGAPVTATLPDGSTATVTALGPQLQPHIKLPLQRAPATITIKATHVTGHVPLLVSDFSVRDDHDRAINLTDQPTPDAPRGTGTLCLTGEFYSGSAQITWRHHATVLALWDFTTELD
jgi:hypothetical protein